MGGKNVARWMCGREGWCVRWKWENGYYLQLYEPCRWIYESCHTLAPTFNRERKCCDDIPLILFHREQKVLISVFSSIKQLGVFLLPLDRMPAHHRITTNITFAGTHSFTWVERGIVRVKCLAQELNTRAVTTRPPKQQKLTIWMIAY